MIIINEESRLNLKPVNQSIRMVYQSAVAITPRHTMDITIFVTKRNIVVLKHGLLLAVEKLFMLKTKIISLSLKDLFPMIHLN